MNSIEKLITSLIDFLFVVALAWIMLFVKFVDSIGNLFGDKEDAKKKKNQKPRK